MKEQSHLSEFMYRNQLDGAYLSHAQQWFTPMLDAIFVHCNGAGAGVVVGINGCQGSGKSTLADYLATQLRNLHGLNVAVLSLDDFYYSHQQRAELAQSVHPLFATRGVPGTHNMPLALETLTQLKYSGTDSCIKLPRFDKKTDDPLPEAQWPVIEGRVDVILFEGWCLGVDPQPAETLDLAVNLLESSQDPNLVWRRYVNQQLQTSFPELYQLIELWVMLKAPSFSVVKQWRFEQEQKLIATLPADSANTKVMDEAQIGHFISFFERLTEHALHTLPAKCDFVYQLNAQRQIVKCHSLTTQTNDAASAQYDFSGKFPLIFTDLDGTLLDHENYSYEAAKPVLMQLKAMQVPVIPNTSKTAAELMRLRQQLQLEGPFIVENGAAVYLPKAQFPQCPSGCGESGAFWLKALVAPRAHWLACIDSVLEQWPTEFNDAFVAMSQMSLDEIVNATGLTQHEARLAADRGYGEPLLWTGSQTTKARFIARLIDAGANVLEGGRFLHVCGHCNKGDAMHWLSEQYQQGGSGLTCTVALGDGNNDINMLEAADVAVVIRSPAHKPPVIARQQHLMISEAEGPSGWAQTLTQLFQLN